MIHFVGIPSVSLAWRDSLQARVGHLSLNSTLPHPHFMLSRPPCYIGQCSLRCANKSSHPKKWVEVREKGQSSRRSYGRWYDCGSFLSHLQLSCWCPDFLRMRQKDAKFANYLMRAWGTPSIDAQLSCTINPYKAVMLDNASGVDSLQEITPSRFLHVSKCRLSRRRPWPALIHGVGQVLGVPIY